MPCIDVIHTYVQAKMKKGMGGVQNDDLTSISKRIKLKEEIFSAVNKNKPEGSFFKRMDYSGFRTPSGPTLSLINVNILLNFQGKRVLRGTF